MAVYTQIDPETIATLLKGYDLGAFKGAQGITAGVENTNYHVFTDRGRAVLTLFEKRTKPADLPFIFAFLNHLGARGIAVPLPYADKRGETVQTLAGKAAVLSRFLEGGDLAPGTLTCAHCAQAGAMLARLHLAADGFEGVRVNPVGPIQWQALMADARVAGASMPPALDEAAARVFPAFAGLEAASLPSGAIHADFFCDNVLFDDRGVTGVIDFGFACTGWLVYDLALAANAWCFDAGVPDRARFAAFAAAYDSVRPLIAVEKAAWEVVRRGAALRIFATRLYDSVFTPKDARVVVKDPNEYALILQADLPWP